MKHRQFGKAAWQCSEIGMGTWTMSGMWGPRDDRMAIDALVRAIELGVDFIDTALIYGNGHSESLVASALRETRANGKVFVATKVPPKNLGWPAKKGIPVTQTFPAKHIVECTETSLRNLRRDYLDIQQLHVWQDAWLKENHWLTAVDQLKSQGKIKHFGISINDHDPNSALEAVASGLIDSVQVIYNIFDQSPAQKLFPLCQEYGVAVIVRVPFDEGSLTGTLKPDTAFHKKDWRRHYFTTERLQECCERLQKLNFLIRDEIQTMAQAALKFCLSHPAVTTVIPGMKRTEHVEANAAVSDGKLLTQEELAELTHHAWQRNFYPVHGE